MERQFDSELREELAADSSTERAILEAKGTRFKEAEELSAESDKVAESNSKTLPIISKSEEIWEADLTEDSDTGNRSEEIIDIDHKEIGIMYPNTFETDVMDDLFYDEAEGPARTYADEFEEFDLGAEDYFDEYDEYDEYGDALEDWASPQAYDQPQPYEEADLLDALEAELADALEAVDTDELLGRIRRAYRRVRSVVRRGVDVARRVGRRVGQVARTVGRVASMIPLPQTQAIGRVASLVGRVAGADDFDALDELVDLAEAEDVLDEAAPVAATLAVHGTMPQAARLSPPTRQQLIRATTQAAQTLATQGGAPAVKALPALVQTAQRVAQQRGMPPRALPQIVDRLVARLNRDPRLARQVIRRLMRTNPAMRQGICASCGRTHSRRRPPMRQPAVR